MIRVIREAHETPECVARELLLAGGRNKFGEANYRAVWGWNRLSWIGGKWEDRNAAGELLRETIELRREPKYFPVNRWHIECWMPPESYGSPEMWFAETLERADGLLIPALGPYPSRGEYEHCFTLEGPARQDRQGGEFVQLTPAVAWYVARAIEFSRGLPRVARRVAMDDRVRREERQYEAYAEEVLA